MPQVILSVVGEVVIGGIRLLCIVMAELGALLDKGSLSRIRGSVRIFLRESVDLCFFFFSFSTYHISDSRLNVGDSMMNKTGTVPAQRSIKPSEEVGHSLPITEDYMCSSTVLRARLSK